MASATAELPPFPSDNAIELVSVKDSKIVSVSVYSGRAEITRLFKFTVKSGLNQVAILGLPHVLDRDSLRYVFLLLIEPVQFTMWLNRVEGRGTATIHDVTISNIVPPPAPTTSPTLTGLLAKQKQTEKALARANKSLDSLQTYLQSVNTGHVDVTKLHDIVRHYDETAEGLDDRVTKLEDELEELATAITAEQEKLSGPTGNQKLNLRASIGVFADSEGEVKIALIYGTFIMNN
jgi:peptidoglycan hydrolase CwlO-like protein